MNEEPIEEEKKETMKKLKKERSKNQETQKLGRRKKGETKLRVYGEYSLMREETAEEYKFILQTKSLLKIHDGAELNLLQ